MGILGALGSIAPTIDPANSFVPRCWPLRGNDPEPRSSLLAESSTVESSPSSKMASQVPKSVGLVSRMVNAFRNWYIYASGYRQLGKKFIHFGAVQ